MPRQAVDRQTIFLHVSGHHSVLGRGTVTPHAETMDEIRAQNLVGWVALIEGRYMGKRPVSLLQIEPVNGATDGQWDDAVASLHSIRAAR